MKESGQSIPEQYTKPRTKEELGQGDVVQELRHYLSENFGSGIDAQRRQEAFKELDFKVRAYASCVQKEQRPSAQGVAELLNQWGELAKRLEEDDFVERAHTLLQPIAIELRSDPVLRELVDREAVMIAHEYLPLGRLLVYERQGQTARLHFLSAKTESRGAIFKDIQTGLSRLAQIAQEDPSLEEVIGTSWIVAKAPRLMERLGFTLGEKIDEETRQHHFGGEDREIREMKMDRKTLLERYLTPHPDA